MRCQELTTTGERCREERIQWLRMVDTGGTLRCVCTAHLQRRPELMRSRWVFAESLRNWTIYGAEVAA